MSIKYNRTDYDIGALDSHWADYQMVQLIGERKKVLEVGCATGYMGQYLKEKCGCELVGVELDPESANKANPHYKQIIVGDISESKTLFSLNLEQFDVILCSNILEHTLKSQEILEKLKSFLKPEGYFVIAFPNIAHWSIRLNLLLGKFDYSEKGILDESHVRFFTLKTAWELFESAGLKIEVFGFDWDNGITKLDGFLRRIPMIGPKFLRFFYSLRPTLFGYQFIFKAKPI